MAAYYNEFKPEAAHMLRQLIKDGLIADGEVDERSILEVKADELKGFTQCHFFAGIGGWSVALRQAGWSDDRPVWTGSCPCQPFSTAGKQKGTADERDLWPVWASLIRECKPSIVFGEQVASAISHLWLDRVRSNMETEGYAVGAAVLPACAVDAPHKRDRLWFVAHSESERSGGAAGSGRSEIERQEANHGDKSGRADLICGYVANATDEGFQVGGRGQMVQSRTEPKPERCGADSVMADPVQPRPQGQRGLIGEHGSEGRQEQTGHDPKTGFWHDHDWIICGDNKARRIPAAKSGICIVAHGVQHRAPLLHAFGNAIVPEVAARFIKACM